MTNLEYTDITVVEVYDVPTHKTNFKLRSNVSLDRPKLFKQGT